MIDFKKLDVSRREEYQSYLRFGGRMCEYSFVNLALWGQQRAAVVDGFLTIFSQANRRTLYLYPLGQGEIKPVLDAIIADARQRGISCCIANLDADRCALLEKLYPGKFRFHRDRDSFDYVYNIDDLADLKGRKFQRKRNLLHRFEDAYPHCQAETITPGNLPAVQDMVYQWYRKKHLDNPMGDFHLEEVAMMRALKDPAALELEGLALMDGGEVLAFTFGSRLTEDTFDIHFEKAKDSAYGAYPAINRAFASYLRDKYPQLRYLNREDDLGLEGLRDAKLSYYPAFLLEKYWAQLEEDTDGTETPLP